MDQSTQTTKKNMNRALIFLAISIVVLGVVIYTAQSRGYFSSTQRMPAPTSVPPVEDNLWMKLTSTTGATQFAQTDQVSLQVSASSSMHDIVGYDALISFDPEFFDIVSTKTLNTNFEVVPFNKTGMISITGTKIPSYSGQLMLNGDNLLSITLKPKKKGTTTVSIQSMAGPERTKMVDTSSAVLLPQLSPITVAIY